MPKHLKRDKMSINSSKIYVLVYKKDFKVIVSTSLMKLLDYVDCSYRTLQRYISKGSYDTETLIIHRIDEIDVLKNSVSYNSLSALKSRNEKVSEYIEYQKNI